MVASEVEVWSSLKLSQAVPIDGAPVQCSLAGGRPAPPARGSLARGGAGAGTDWHQATAGPYFFGTPELVSAFVRFCQFKAGIDLQHQHPRYH